MKSFFSKGVRFLHRLQAGGFILPFTMLICVLILLVTSTSMTLLSKQLYFSKLYKQSQSAYYAADDALACALSIDDLYQGADGLGIFPSTNAVDTFTYMDSVVTYINQKRADAGSSDRVSLDGVRPVVASPIQCGQAVIFDAAPASSSKFATTTYERTYVDPTLGAITEYGVSSIFTMRMDLGIDPSVITGPVHLYRCAKVTVNKTTIFRQIISQGYSTCDNLNSAVERAVVNTTKY